MVIEMGSSHKSPQKRHLQINFPYPDFVNASLTRNSLPTNLNENAIFSIPLVGYGDAILFISHRVTQTKIITSDYQVVTAAL